MIGINDVWRRFGTRAQFKEHVPLDEYASTLEELVRDTLPGLRGLVLMTPYYIEPDRSDPMRKMMDEYGAVMRDLAGRYGAVLVDTQAAFDKVLEKVGPETLADDKVHPNLTGHFVITLAFLRAIDAGRLAIGI
jgi:lysophospholipase L1-like esterase